MTAQAPSRTPAPLRGAAAREKRATLFEVTLGAGVVLAMAGMMSAIPHWYGLPYVTVFGLTFQLHPLPVCWCAAVYPFVLAARAIWLPDDKLRTAARNLWLIVGLHIVLAGYILVRLFTAR